ncbi:uncharacterized protein LOC120267384 [Dioscorea cayenensis subsp. rotundata]|uniref:Uncharacterized protein LOC120267384 n=1 Tax=Dioscorea cayennensis subsp. rotundata TaxID=55577 RepID=A0AB40BU36_DIOCR|nr:uncharacterized protein LOC120267384 [Dioscorea cayenensis subsp. rotundata]
MADSSKRKRMMHLMTMNINKSSRDMKIKRDQSEFSLHFGLVFHLDSEIEVLDLMYEDYFTAERSSMDSSNVFFLQSSDNPGIMLVSKPFDGNGYGAWRRAMEIALTAKNKLVFVNGSCKRPSVASIDLQNWERCNSIVISWILNGLTSDISGSVVYIKTAREMWLELEGRFGQLNGPLLYQLQKELSQVYQGYSSVTSYFTRIKSLWDEIQCLNDMPLCQYCMGVEQAKYEEKQKLAQLLMGLNESYSATRGNILMMKPFPSVREAYSIWIEKEKQREVSSTMQFNSEVVSMNAGSLPRNYSTKNVPQFPYKNKSDFRKIICEYCKKTGHSKDKCFKNSSQQSDEIARNVNMVTNSTTMAGPFTEEASGSW